MRNRRRPDREAPLPAPLRFLAFARNDNRIAVRWLRMTVRAGAPRGIRMLSGGHPQMKSRLLGRSPAAPRDLIHADTARVEPRRRPDHLVDGLVEVRGRFALKTERVDAGDDERFEIGALEPPLLEARDRRVHRLVELEQLARALVSSLDGPR